MDPLDVALVALTRIAAFYEGPVVSKSFDEPASAATARRAIRTIQHLLKERPMNTCLVTGCALVDTVNNRTVWGDLHQIGNAYVFNACLDGGETAWQSPIPPMLDSTPSATISDIPYEPTFERRGVFIIEQCAVTLNSAAQARIRP